MDTGRAVLEPTSTCGRVLSAAVRWWQLVVPVQVPVPVPVPARMLPAERLGACDSKRATPFINVLVLGRRNRMEAACNSCAHVFVILHW